MYCLGCATRDLGDVANLYKLKCMGGGLHRSMGGWRAVADLRRGREAYRSDERVLGSSAFVEALRKRMLSCFFSSGMEWGI